MLGIQETPYFPVKEEYVFVNDVPEEDRIRGDLPPTKKEDCEVCVRLTCIFFILLSHCNDSQQDVNFCRLGLCSYNFVTRDVRNRFFKFQFGFSSFF